MKQQALLLLVVSFGLITIIFGTIYITEQQSLRIGANDLQIQLAEDTATALNNGVAGGNIDSHKIDLARSLTAFIIVYDKTGHIVSGNGYLNNRIPTIPLGVLQQAQGRSYSFVTWQPQADVRIASVSVAANNYYVLSGRSLKEVEKREDILLQLVLIGWLGSILVILVVVGLSLRLVKTGNDIPKSR